MWSLSFLVSCYGIDLCFCIDFSLFLGSCPWRLCSAFICFMLLNMTLPALNIPYPTEAWQNNLPKHGCSRSLSFFVCSDYRRQSFSTLIIRLNRSLSCRNRKRKRNRSFKSCFLRLSYLGLSALFFILCFWFLFSFHGFHYQFLFLHPRESFGLQSCEALLLALIEVSGLCRPPWFFHSSICFVHSSIVTVMIRHFKVHGLEKGCSTTRCLHQTASKLRVGLNANVFKKHLTILYYHANWQWREVIKLLLVSPC